MAERICGNCKHFKSCQGVDKSDTPEDMLCNDFEIGSGDGGKDIGDNVETAATEKQKAPEKQEASKSAPSRRKSTPKEEPEEEIAPPEESGDDDNDLGLPPEEELEETSAPTEEPEENPEDTPEDDAYEEADMGWNPYEEDTMSQYRKPKAARLKLEAEKAGINIKGMKPKQVHEALLNFAADQEEYAAATAPVEEGNAAQEIPTEKDAPEGVLLRSGSVHTSTKAELPGMQSVPRADLGRCTGYAAGNTLTKFALVGVRAQMVSQRMQLDEQIAALDAVIATL